MNPISFKAAAPFIPTVGHDDGPGIPIGPAEDGFPVVVRCRITSDELQAMGRPGRDSVERSVNRCHGLAARLRAAGFILDKTTGLPEGPWVQWVSVETDAFNVVQWQRGKPE